MLFFYNPANRVCVIPIGTNMSMKIPHVEGGLVFVGSVKAGGGCRGSVHGRLPESSHEKM